MLKTNPSSGLNHRETQPSVNVLAARLMELTLYYWNPRRRREALLAGVFTTACKAGVLHGARAISVHDWASPPETLVSDTNCATKMLVTNPRSPISEQPLSVSSLVRAYLRRFPETHGSKRRHLEFLQRHPFATKDARVLRTQDLVAHIQARCSEGISTATAANELTWIGVVLREAESEGLLTYSAETLIGQARRLCRQQQLIAASVSTRRNPTPEERLALDQYFAKQRGKASIPMKDIVTLAAIADLRAAEICRLEWPDTTAGPGLLSSRSRYLTLNAKAWEIIERQPRTDSRVFPFKAKSICAAFAIACKVLKIENVSFDDIRHRRKIDRSH